MQLVKIEILINKKPNKCIEAIKVKNTKLNNALNNLPYRNIMISDSGFMCLAFDYFKKYQFHRDCSFPFYLNTFKIYLKKRDLSFLFLRN